MGRFSGRRENWVRMREERNDCIRRICSRTGLERVKLSVIQALRWWQSKFPERRDPAKR